MLVSPVLRRLALIGLIGLFVTAGLVPAVAPAMAAHAAPRLALGNLTSSNWAGYFAPGSNATVTKVSGTWVQPALSCTSATRYVAIWVGIDGAMSGTVEQTGTLGVCFGGLAVYEAWWEMYPMNAIQPISTMTVSAGDTIHATVTYAGGNFVMKIVDGTQSFSMSSNQTAQRNSAECIVERPSTSAGLTSLAKFGTTKFSSCSATISGATHPLGGFAGVTRITMVDASKLVLASTSSISATHGAFAVTWHRAS